MKEAIAIRHVSFEDLGLLEPLLRARGFDITYVDAWDLGARDAGSPDLVVILGGPISVNAVDDYPFLADEIALAAARIRADRPTLGICLGAQVMARAIGGGVAPGVATEIGWAPVTLTGPGQASVLAPLAGVPVLHWHGDVCALPDGTPSLATTPACPTQAFVPSRRTLALQFHIEADAAGIEAWLVGHAAEIAATPGVTAAQLRKDSARCGDALRDAAAETIRRWLTAPGAW